MRGCDNSQGPTDQLLADCGATGYHQRPRTHGSTLLEVLSGGVGVERRGVLFFLPFPEWVTSLLPGFTINLRELANPNGGALSCIMSSLGASESDLLQSGAVSYPLPTHLTLLPGDRHRTGSVLHSAPQRTT